MNIVRVLADLLPGGKPKPKPSHHNWSGHPTGGNKAHPSRNKYLGQSMTAVATFPGTFLRIVRYDDQGDFGYNEQAGFKTFFLFELIQNLCLEQLLLLLHFVHVFNVLFFFYQLPSYTSICFSSFFQSYFSYYYFSRSSSSVFVFFSSASCSFQFCFLGVTDQL